MRILVRLLIVSFLAATTSLRAITYIVPPDRDLATDAEMIVVARGVVSHCETLPSGAVVTIAELVIEDVLKGPVERGTTIRLTEAGGIVGNYGVFIPGAPRYDAGRQYVIFAGRSKFGEWSTYALGLGKFTVVQDLAGREILLRGDDGAIFGFSKNDWSPHTERLRLKEGFLTYVQTVLAGNAAAARDDYFVDRKDVVLAHFAPTTRSLVATTVAISDYLGAGNLRWKVPSTTIVYCCDATPQPAPLDGVGAFSSALASWNGAGAGVSYQNGGRNDAATGGLQGYGRGNDHLNAVLFNDPFNDLPNPTGGFLIGVGGGSGWSYTGPDGQIYFGPDVPGNPAGEVDVEINDGLGPLGQIRFTAGVTHEIGHTLGLRHADKDRSDNGACGPPLVCSGSAIMVSFINQDYVGLQQWDSDAIQTVYGSGPVCTPPSIGTQPSGVTITAGEQTTLTVSATGTSLTYQWYIGSSGTTTTPAPGGTGSQLTVSPSTTTNYWVRVTGQCAPTADSRTAIVTVNCAPPSVPTPNASPSSISSGQSSTLSASPTGSGSFTYQWYIGNSGDTSNLITGATSSSTSVSPTVTTNYWVKVTGQCGTFNSPATTVTVVCTPIALGGVGAQPPTINVGQSSTISVTTNGSGPFTFQWFRGSLGDFSNPIATTSSTLVSPTTSTSYWVRVTAPCGSQDGNVTVFVNAPCTPSSITTHPAFATIAPGASTTLTVIAAGTAPISYQWYTGTSGNTGNPIPNATNASITVSPTVSTSYWVRVSNSCNPTGNNSTTALVTVSANCPAATITTQPASVSAGLGTAATLKVVATVTGTTIHYQWYKGAKGDLSTKVGTDSDTFTTGAVGVTTSYWVRLTSACNNLTFTDSNAAIVTATATPKGRAVRH